MRAQNPLSARQPANGHRRVLAAGHCCVIIVVNILINLYFLSIYLFQFVLYVINLFLAEVNYINAEYYYNFAVVKYKLAEVNYIKV